MSVVARLVEDESRRVTLVQRPVTTRYSACRRYRAPDVMLNRFLIGQERVDNVLESPLLDGLDPSQQSHARSCFVVVERRFVLQVLAHYTIVQGWCQPASRKARDPKDPARPESQKVNRSSNVLPRDLHSVLITPAFETSSDVSLCNSNASGPAKAYEQHQQELQQITRLAAVGTSTTVFLLCPVYEYPDNSWVGEGHYAATWPGRIVLFVRTSHSQVVFGLIIPGHSAESLPPPKPVGPGQSGSLRDTAWTAC